MRMVSSRPPRTIYKAIISKVAAAAAAAHPCLAAQRVRAVYNFYFLYIENCMRGHVVHVWFGGGAVAAACQHEATSIFIIFPEHVLYAYVYLSK